MNHFAMCAENCRLYSSVREECFVFQMTISVNLDNTKVVEDLSISAVLKFHDLGH
jgi:hypothetical protein